jgi:hypothetical protein
VPLVTVGRDSVVVSTCMLRGSFTVPLVLMHDVARLGATVIIEHREVCPFLNLSLPVGQCPERRDDEKRASDALAPPDMVEHRDGLGRLAQAHLVSEDHGAMIVPAEEKPVEPIELVGLQNVAILVLGRGSERCEVGRGGR